jgi:hypothetical protein
LRFSKRGDAYSSFQFSPDNWRVVYWADQETDNQIELFAALDEFRLYLPLTISN